MSIQNTIQTKPIWEIIQVLSNISHQNFYIKQCNCFSLTYFCVIYILFICKVISGTNRHTFILVFLNDRDFVMLSVMVIRATVSEAWCTSGFFLNPLIRNSYQKLYNMLFYFILLQTFPDYAK